MSEGRTEREALLEARIKELEAAQAKGAVTVAQGGMFESVWRAINSIVPPWLSAVALAVFAAHYGFSYYLQGQLSQAETQLKQAQADVETAKAKAANTPADASGVPIRLATVKAQMEKTVAEAAGAKATATALKVQVNGETVALQKAKAELDSLQNQARLAQAKADAESARFGLPTLEDRAVKAKLIIQQLKTVEKNVEAQQNAALARGMGGSNTQAVGIAMVRGECLNNPYAELIDCPSQFVRQQQQDSPQVATAPSGNDSQYWKVPNSCVPAWRYFQNEAIHGAFAVTKFLKGGGCGYSWSPSRPIEDMRREAMAHCANYATTKRETTCKIIGEK